MNAISELKRGALTKSQQETFAAALIEEILSGNANALEVEVYLKSMEKLIETVRKNPYVKDAVIAEAVKYGEKTFDHLGCKITVTGKQTFDYSSCCSSEWDKLDAEIKSLSARKKELEEHLKTLKVSYSTLEGEIINPPTVSRSEFFTIKF